MNNYYLTYDANRQPTQTQETNQVSKFNFDDFFDLPNPYADQSSIITTSTPTTTTTKTEEEIEIPPTAEVTEEEVKTLPEEKKSKPIKVPAVTNRTIIGGNKKDFIKEFSPYADRIQKETGIDKRFILAQIGLETGWGKYANSYNFGNIIAQRGYTGNSVVRGDKDAQGNPKSQRFRAYNNLDEATTDYINLMRGQRYKSLSGLSAENAAKLISKTGYAEDPRYSNKILEILKDL